MTIAEWLTKHDRYKRKVDARLRAERNSIIEECARIADDFRAKAVAFHIRALKDKQ